MPEQRKIVPQPERLQHYLDRRWNWMDDDWDDPDPDVGGDVDDYFGDFRFEPRDDEAAIIARIRALVKEQYGATLNMADQSLERFYESVRVFDLDRENEKVYRRREDGSYVEDWTRLKKEAIDQALWDLQRALGRLERESTELEMQMKFAYVKWDDAYQEAYLSPVPGVLDTKATIHDRTANARGSTVDERHYYLYCYWLWRTVSDRIRYLADVRRSIEQKAYRDVQSSRSR